MVVLKSVVSFRRQVQYHLLRGYISVVMITLGQVIAYGIGAGFFRISGGWRWMVGLGAVPAGVQLVFLFFLPESRTFYDTAITSERRY